MSVILGTRNRVLVQDLVYGFWSDDWICKRFTKHTACYTDCPICLEYAWSYYESRVIPSVIHTCRIRPVCGPIYIDSRNRVNLFIIFTETHKHNNCSTHCLPHSETMPCAFFSCKITRQLIVYTNFHIILMLSVGLPRDKVVAILDN